MEPDHPKGFQEIVVGLRRDPRRADAESDVGHPHPRGLGRFQKLDVSGVVRTGGAGNNELFADVPGKVLLSGVELSGLRILPGNLLDEQ